MLERGPRNERRFLNAARQLRDGSKQVIDGVRTVLPVLIPAAVGAIYVAREIRKSREATNIHIDNFDSRALHPIIELAYGDSIEAGNPQYRPLQKPDLLAQPEHVKRAFVDVQNILEWAWDKEGSKHFDPPPGIPVHDVNGIVEGYRKPDLNNEADVLYASAELARYYYNDGKPDDLMTFVARDQNNILRGALSVRMDGDPYFEDQRLQGIAILERGIVDPLKKRKGIFGKLIDRAHQFVFEDNEYKQSRTWIMTDPQSGDYRVNFNFFVWKRGFRIIPTEDSLWSVAAQRRKIDSGGRQATLLYFQPGFTGQQPRKGKNL